MDSLKSFQVQSGFSLERGLVAWETSVGINGLFQVTKFTLNE